MKEIGTCKDCRWLRRQQSATEKGDFCLMGICNSAPDFISGEFFKDPETFGCIHWERKP